MKIQGLQGLQGHTQICGRRLGSQPTFRPDRYPIVLSLHLRAPLLFFLSFTYPILFPLCLVVKCCTLSLRGTTNNSRSLHCWSDCVGWSSSLVRCKAPQNNPPFLSDSVSDNVGHIPVVPFTHPQANLLYNLLGFSPHHISSSQQTPASAAAMELARALTHRKKQATDGPSSMNRATSMKSSHGTIKRSAISSPVQLLSSSNALAYNAPNIYASSDESDNSMTFSGSSRATTPDSEAPSPMEPNHLSMYFNSASSRRSKDSIDNESPPIPKRMPSHTRKSHQEAARKRSESQTLQQPPTTIHSSPSTNVRTSSDMFSAKPDPSHPFGAELAQVNEVAEGFGAREVIIMDEEEQYLMEHGLCKFGAEDYIDEVQGLFGGIHNNPFSPFTSVWI